MSGQISKALLYTVQPGDMVNALIVKEVASLALNGGYTNLVPLTVNGQVHLFGYKPTADLLDVYRFSDSGPWLQDLQATPQVGAGWEIVEPFVVGNRPHLLCYAAKLGIFEFFEVGDDLSISKPYEFYRNHEPGITHGFTTVKPFATFGQVVFMGYNGSDGHVALYSLAVTATSLPDVPPLLLTSTWSHQWAKGWTRFAFFQFGSENFFLKTNTWKPNVNIDHVLDNLSGTVEVATNLDLKDAQLLEIVQPFTIENGSACFVTYKNDGEVTLNRFHGDCLGWTPVALLISKSGATQVVPLRIKDQVFLLIA